MTVKVYMNDGRIEEYPNTHITWEWDDAEGELGPDSGFRINAIDKTCTTVSAFVYPSECTKIEITSEECDMVFKRPPSEEIISGKRFRRFAEIDKVCKQQDETWGERNLPMLGKRIFDGFQFTNEEILENQVRYHRKRCMTDDYSWFDILHEKICEAFLGAEPGIQREKLIQAAAAVVQIVEYLDRKEENK